MYNSAFPKTSILCFNVHVDASIDSLPYACYMENIFRIAFIITYVVAVHIWVIPCQTNALFDLGFSIFTQIGMQVDINEL